MTIQQTSPPPVYSEPTPTDSAASKLNPLGYLDKVKKAKQDAALIQWANSEYDRCKRSRASVERQWYLNLAFYFGKQNVRLITTTTSSTGWALNTPKAPPWRVRIVINKIRPIIRTELAKLTASKPSFDVVPATTEDEDIVAARVGEAIVEAAYRDKQIDRVLRETVWWGVICGTSYIKTYWDSSGYVNDQQVGDACIEKVDPFHLFVPNLLEEDIEKQPYVIHATTKDPKYLKANYGIDVNSNVKSTDDLLEDSFLNLVGAQQEKKDEVLCLEFWIKRGCHPAFPNGGLLTLCGDQILVNTGMPDPEKPDVPVGYPYLHGEFPFGKFTHVPTGKFYGDSVVTDLVPLQREYNRTRSQIIEAKNLMAKPKLLAPRGSINPRQVTSEPGQVILYTPGFDRPTPLEMAPLPSYVLQELDRLQQDMDDISGQHEISRGQNPSQVTAATALSFLQEQDESKLSYSISSVEEMIEKVGRQFLKFVTQFWDVPRMVRTTGTDNAFEAQEWKGSDLKGNTDIRVQAGSALPKSKAAKQAFIMDLLKLGIVDPAVGLELLDLGGIEKAYEDILVDKRQAQRENFRMKAIADDPKFQMTSAVAQLQQTQPDYSAFTFPANTYDNHALHIAVHNAYRKTQGFEMLDPQVKQIFEEHVTMHQIAAQQGVQSQLPDGQPGPVVGGPPQDPNAPQQQQQGPPQDQQQPQDQGVPV